MPTVFGSSTDGYGVVGLSTNNSAVRGRSTNSYGVFGDSVNAVGVVGDTVSQFSAVWGHNRGAGTGVLGSSDGGGNGVHGAATGSGQVGVVGGQAGVVGDHTDPGGTGVLGNGSRGVVGNGISRNHQQSIGVVGGGDIGVYAGTRSGTALRAQVLLDGIRAAEFFGDVEVNGNLAVANGNKPFKIDHPLDPQNKYLLHNAVESSEMKNVYDGVAHLDEDGSAWVDLPEWFEALNGEFRYQLTAVGQAAPNLHVAEEVSENRFKIAGGEGGMKVCWQLTGTRKDPWAAANPFEVEQEKPQEERGRYLQPSLYDAPEEQSVMRARLGGAPPMPPSLERPQPPARPPGAPGMPPGALEMPPGVAAPGFGHMEEEHRRQIDELRGQIEELRRGRLEEEIDELRRQIKKLQRRRKR